jgi:ribulose 1,5-bisphosphate synthetase/thiazole synthase
MTPDCLNGKTIHAARTIRMRQFDVIIVGKGNAALCAALTQNAAR